MKSLVGYTGFVGSNICRSEKFEGLYDSKNVQMAYGTKPNILVYSGVPAQKFIANKFPERDFEVIQNAIENIRNINPKKIVLISTIDVYEDPNGVNEDTVIKEDKLEPYGKNRYFLEKWIKENFNDYLIVHLPALFGVNIKKNFIYDLINIIPSMIKNEKFEELKKINNFIEKFYEKQDNGFYKYIDDIPYKEKSKLKAYFMNIGFSALNFTDSRAVYQFYNLKYLWKHINVALENNIRILNLAVEPVSAGKIYRYVIGKEFCNEILDFPPVYDFKTKYFEVFGGRNGYIFDENAVLEELKEFVEIRRIQ